MVDPAIKLKLAGLFRSALMSEEITFNAKMLYGFVDVRSWIEFDGEKYIGMGMKTVYDHAGNVVERTAPKPTGVVMVVG